MRIQIKIQFQIQIQTPAREVRESSLDHVYKDPGLNHGQVWGTGARTIKRV